MRNNCGPHRGASRTSLCRNARAVSARFTLDRPQYGAGDARSFSATTTNEDDDDDDDFYYDTDSSQRPRTALVVGSSGSLGRTVAKHLSKTLGFRVIGADVAPPRTRDEQYLSGGFVELPTIQISETTSEPAGLSDLTMALADGLHQLLDGDSESGGNNNKNNELDAVVCVAGAWEGDPPPLPPLETYEDDDDDETNHRRMWLAAGARAYSETIEHMMGKNLYPVLAAGYASQHFMTTGEGVFRDEYGESHGGESDDNDGGLFVAIGATVALGGTPGMLGYGLSKVATHHYLQTLGETTGKAVTSKSKRKSTRSLRLEHGYLGKLSVVGILPTTIDTRANREAMPGADFDSWTKSIDIAREIGQWMVQPALRPHSGSLLKVHPNHKTGCAEFRVAR